MTAQGRCEVHQLVRGPDGLCVLCRREQSTGPSVPVEASPAASTKVAVSVTVGGVIVLGAIAAVVLLGPLGSSVDSQRAEPIVTATPALPEPDPEAAARAAELEKIAKANIWQQPPAPAPVPNPASAPPPNLPTDPKQLGVAPVPPFPGAVITPEQFEAEQRRLREEAERDRVRHAEIAAEMERRAKEHELQLQAASLAEARGKIKIDMYSADWCGSCRKAIAYLQTQPDLSYTVHNVDREPGAREKMRALNPEHSLPTFQIDGDVTVGFGQRSFEHALDTAARKRAGLPL